MSPRALPRQAQICWRPPSECQDPAGGVRRLWLVGKQTTNSNRTASTTPSFPPEPSSRSVIVRRASPRPCLSRQAGYLASFRYTDLTSSAKLRLLRSASDMTLVRFAHKPLTIHELLHNLSTRGLTGLAPEGYIPPNRGRSRCSGPTESRNGPLARLSPEIVERAVLTFCETRSTTRRLSVQDWLVSRPFRSLKAWFVYKASLLRQYGLSDSLCFRGARIAVSSIAISVFTKAMVEGL